jgi:hypothetical protein
MGYALRGISATPPGGVGRPRRKLNRTPYDVSELLEDPIED